MKKKPAWKQTREIKAAMSMKGFNLNLTQDQYIGLYGWHRLLCGLFVLYLAVKVVDYYLTICKKNNQTVFFNKRHNLINTRVKKTFKNTIKTTVFKDIPEKSVNHFLNYYWYVFPLLLFQVHFFFYSKAFPFTKKGQAIQIYGKTP